MGIFVVMINHTENTNSGQGAWIGKYSRVKAQTSEGSETFEGVLVADPVSVDDANNGRGPRAYIVHDLDLNQYRIVMSDKIKILDAYEESLFESKHRDKYPTYFESSK